MPAPSDSQGTRQMSHCTIHPCSRTVEQTVDAPVPLIQEQIVIDRTRKYITHGRGPVIQ